MNNIQNISGYLPPEWIEAWKGQAESRTSPHMGRSRQHV